MSNTDKPFRKIEKEKLPINKSVPKKKRKWILLPIGIILAVIISLGLYFVYKAYKVSSNIGLNLSPQTIFTNNKKDPELKKDSTGKYTNVMIVGIDTRGSNSGLMNTDSIMIASYNYDTKDVVMISVPRDLHAQITEGVNWYNKINSVYATAEQKSKDTGLDRLKAVVEQVTGMQIQYFAMIDYKGFVELIDAVGGVYVNVENSFTDYMYPDGNGYKTVRFKSGPQLMDGSTALEYSRSRHSGQNNEGSDFARAKRQQKVLIALKDTLLSSETLLNPTKLTELMSAIQNNVKVSEFTLDDVQAGINLLKNFDSSNGKTYSFVLDPTAGNYSLIKVGPNPTLDYFIMPAAGEGKFEDINSYVSTLLQNPQLYEENPSSYVYNVGLGYQNSYKKTQELRDKFKYMNVKFLGTLYSDKEGNYIYSHKENQFISSVDEIAQFIGTENKVKPGYITSNLHGENITILLGKEVPKVNSQITSEASN